MDIIFQSGEFYGESSGFFLKILGSVIGALISGSFAILVFVLGTSREKKKNIKKENERISELSDYLKTAVQLVQEKAIAQSKYLIDFSHTMKNRDFKDRTLYSSVALTIEGIRSIPYTDLYKLFTAKNLDKAKKFNEFQTYIELIHTYKDYIPNLLIHFNESFRKIQIDFGDEVSKFFGIYDKISKDYDHELVTDIKEIIDFWALKIKVWKELDEDLIKNYRTDPYIVYDNIIKPIIDFIRSKHFELQALEILNSANNCEFHLKNFDHARNMNRKRCLITARELIKVRNNLNEIIKNCL